jgi:hypothetical protein
VTLAKIGVNHIARQVTKRIAFSDRPRSIAHKGI